MKRKISSLVITLLFVTTAISAQDLAYSKGSVVTQAGVGLGAGVGLPISLSLDYGLTDKISLGAVAGFSSWKGYGISVTYIPAGVRGAYHFYNTEKIDAYGGAMLGYLVATASGSVPGMSFGGFMWGGYAGGRYFFTKSLGAFAEVGYTSLGYATVGIAFKF